VADHGLSGSDRSRRRRNSLQPGTLNHGLAPQRASLAVDNAPQGWTVELRGGGREVAAALVDYNAKASLELKIKVPREAKAGKHTLPVKATAPRTNL
jgi:uncharacterized membrane protein